MKKTLIAGALCAAMGLLCVTAYIGANSVKTVPIPDFERAFVLTVDLLEYKYTKKKSSGIEDDKASIVMEIMRSLERRPDGSNWRALPEKRHFYSVLYSVETVNCTLACRVYTWDDFVYKLEISGDNSRWLQDGLALSHALRQHKALRGLKSTVLLDGAETD
jgi:hypothetical protein